MERKKRSKGRGWESCYVKKIYGTFGVEMRAYGQKLVKFCTHTHASPIVVTIVNYRIDNSWTLCAHVCVEHAPRGTTGCPPTVSTMTDAGRLAIVG